jgi:hypothetical protein
MVSIGNGSESGMRQRHQDALGVINDPRAGWLRFDLLHAVKYTRGFWLWNEESD